MNSGNAGNERGRAEFEKFAVGRTWSIKRRADGDYEDSATFIGSIVWQAARLEERKRWRDLLERIDGHISPGRPRP
jgi:hypothetical protein